MCRSVSRAVFVVAVICAAAVAHAQTVDEIVAKNLQAKGGAEKWKSVTSVKMTGKVSMQGMDLPLTVYAKRPNYSRQEVIVKDLQVIQAFDGTTAWYLNPMMGANGPQEAPGAQAEIMKNSADFDGALIDYKSKGHAIELVGKEKLDVVVKDKIDTVEVYHLKLTMKNGHVMHYYLDATSGIELKTSAEVDVGTGMKQPLETEMSNYQRVNGIMIPHTIKQMISGKPVAEMRLDKVEFNVPVDDTLFKMPKK